MKNEERAAKIKVYSDGKAIEENIAVVSAFVSKAINEISCAKIVFAGGNTPVGKFPFSDKDTINPGKTVRIDIECEKDQKTVFEGVVVKKRISVRDTNVLLTDIELTFKAKGMASTEISADGTTVIKGAMVMIN